jgi:hypothetical protein
MAAIWTAFLRGRCSATGALTPLAQTAISHLQTGALHSRVRSKLRLLLGPFVAIPWRRRRAILAVKQRLHRSSSSNHLSRHRRRRRRVLHCTMEHLAWSEGSKQRLKAYTSSNGGIEREFCGECGTTFVSFKRIKVTGVWTLP